jgi:hypothetical protein
MLGEVKVLALSASGVQKARHVVERAIFQHAEHDVVDRA